VFATQRSRALRRRPANRQYRFTVPEGIVPDVKPGSLELHLPHQRRKFIASLEAN